MGRKGFPIDIKRVQNFWQKSGILFQDWIGVKFAFLDEKFVQVFFTVCPQRDFGCLFSIVQLGLFLDLFIIEFCFRRLDLTLNPQTWAWCDIFQF